MLIITDGESYYAYSGVPFGLASAPLLWGRISAWPGRLAQAASQPSHLRTQLYIDDPILENFREAHPENQQENFKAPSRRRMTRRSQL